jgi:hypothetical protein
MARPTPFRQVPVFRPANQTRCFLSSSAVDNSIGNYTAVSFVSIRDAGDNRAIEAAFTATRLAGMNLAIY